jgi:predicted CxxxxCH...CXXCH cytochrome family protein
MVERIPTLAGGITLAALVLATHGCLDTRGDSTPKQNACTPCHGSALRDGSDLEQAAPPFDLSGRTDPRSRGAGAHEIHLSSGKTHGKLACTECHVVPDAVDTPGHADNAYPAEVVLGSLAAKGNRSPVYDATTFSCTDSYCHRTANPKWTEPRSSEEACGTCHGLPPPPPHQQSADCNRGHAEVIAADLSFVAPELHVNGVLNESSTCSSCHGAPPAPPHPQFERCSFCHGRVESDDETIKNPTLHRDGAPDVDLPSECNRCHGGDTRAHRRRI